MNRILCSSPYIPRQWIAAHFWNRIWSSLPGIACTSALRVWKGFVLCARLDQQSSDG